MDFFANQQGSKPVVTAERHLDLLLGHLGLTIESLAMPESVLLPITPSDLRAVRRLLDLAEGERLSIGGAGFYRKSGVSGPLGVVGPAVGAPNVALVLENLAVLGVRRVIALGWCGSLQPWLRIGALVLPRQAIREEGTSYHYVPSGVVPQASVALAQALTAAGERAAVPVAEGTVWSTDALYREARAKITSFGAQGILAVEMETSAIFAVSAHLGLEAAVLLLVSDELAGPEWRVGFHERSFRAAHERACKVAIAACECLSDPLLSA